MGLLLRPRPRRTGLQLPVLLALLAAPLASRAGQDAPFPNSFDATSHRSFANVDSWRKAFDDPARDDWQRPAEVVAALEITPGSTVVDVGAGTGYFAPHLSRAVGATGTVLAVETEPNMVTELRARAEREGIRNLVPVLASADNPRVPPGIADVVLIVDTYHHIDERLQYLRALKRTLRPQGRVAIIDWKKEPLPIGPELDHKLAREQVVYEMTTAGYALEREPTFLPYQYFLMFRASGEKKERAGEKLPGPLLQEKSPTGEP